MRIFDPAVEWRPLTQVAVRGQSTVYRGHEGVRKFMREVDEALPRFKIEDLDIKDLGERIVWHRAPSRARQGERAETESPIGWVSSSQAGESNRVDDYLDPEAALEAAGLSE